MNTFLGIFAGVNECSFVQNSCLSRLDLVILWLHVAKNYGVAEIRVFLGRIFGVSLASGSEETWRFQNSCLFWVGFLAFLWPHVAKKHGVSEIHVFLGRTNFILWVSSLAGVVNWK